MSTHLNGHDIGRCPFCGGNAWPQTSGDTGHWKTAVWCNACGAVGPSANGEGESVRAEAIRLWNLRFQLVSCVQRRGAV